MLAALLPLFRAGMTFRAEGLPIALVPEEIWVAPVRLDVIENRAVRRGILSDERDTRRRANVAVAGEELPVGK